MIKDRVFSVIVKPKSRKTELLEYDAKRKAYIILVSAPAEGNKANIELVKFLSKYIGKKVWIKSGLKSKNKIIQTE